MSKYRALSLVVCSILAIAITGCASGADKSKEDNMKVGGTNSSQPSKLPDSIPTKDDNKIKPEELGKIQEGFNDGSSSKAQQSVVVVELVKPVTALTAVPKSVQTTITEVAKKKQTKLVDLQLVGGRLRVVFPKDTKAEQLHELAQAIAKNPEVKFAEPEVQTAHQKR